MPGGRGQGVRRAHTSHTTRVSHYSAAAAAAAEVHCAGVRWGFKLTSFTGKLMSLSPSRTGFKFNLSESAPVPLTEWGLELRLRLPGPGGTVTRASGRPSLSRQSVCLSRTRSPRVQLSTNLKFLQVECDGGRGGGMSCASSCLSKWLRVGIQVSTPR